MLARLEHWAQLLAWGAAAALAVAAGVTLADILLRGAGRFTGLVTGEPLGLGIVGVVDIVQLGVVTAAWLAIPWAFATGGHVTVDLVWGRLPATVRELLGAVAAAVACVFLAATFRYCLDQALAVRAYGDRSATLQIPLVWYWLPVLFGLALSTVIAAGHTVVRTTRFLACAAGRR